MPTPEMQRSRALVAEHLDTLFRVAYRLTHNTHDAQDLVQGFFAKLLEKGDLAAVERSKGKFRSFLMVACTYYLANQAHHHRARRRGHHAAVDHHSTSQLGAYQGAVGACLISLRAYRGSPVGRPDRRLGG